MSRPLFSIITPTHNRRRALERAIRSVQMQSCGDYEHLIVDDHSTDDTEQLVRGIGDPRIRYTRLDAWRGANVARNVGIELARAPWLSFLDSDDEYLPHRLSDMIGWQSESRQCALLLSSFRTLRRGRPRLAVNPDVELSQEELEAALVTHAICIAGTSITVHREAIQRAGGFAPHIRRMQDREALLSLSQQCGARLLSSIDWIKHPSADSISEQPAGYVESLHSLLDAHPRLAAAYRSPLAYHVARRIVHEATHGRVLQAVRSWRVNRRATLLGFTFRQLVAGYFQGAARRKSLAATLRQREQPRPPTAGRRLVDVQRRTCSVRAA